MVDYNRKWYAANRDKHILYVGSHRKHKIHTCKICGKGEPDVSFYIKRNGDRYYRRFICYGCDIEYHKQYPTTVQATERERQRRAAKLRVDRQLPNSRFKYILSDSKKSDKRSGRRNDLNLAFVQKKISGGCSYCGDTESKMTLDRINNILGHTKRNVVAACVRCNMFRRDMPYKAWLLLVPGLKLVKSRGYLDGWKSGTMRHHAIGVRVEDVKVVENL